MYSFALLASLALLAAHAVRAAVYVTQPVQSTVCTGGQSCDVAWVDDGTNPLLSTIGNCDVAVYTGQMVLVQSLQSVDVSTTSSFSFTPDPSAGPNGQYYLVFTSSSISYQGFSGSFTLTGMTGTTPGGGPYAPTSTPTTTSSGSSSSAGTSTPGYGTSIMPSGTSTPATGIPSQTSLPIPSGTTTPSVPPVTMSHTTPTTPTTTTSPKPTTTSTPTPTPSNAAGRVGASTSLGGLVAAFVLSYVLAF